MLKTTEHNTRLATLQQELDKFNEDRQGNKDKGEREEKLPQTVGQTNEEREEEHSSSLMASKSHTNVSKTKA